MLLKRTTWGSIDGESVELFSVEDPETGFHVLLSNYGATLVRIRVPDYTGAIDDVILGHDDVSNYPTSPYYGHINGRVTNRISNAQFTLEGTTYHLPKNDYNNCIHGGLKGFSHKIWSVVSFEMNSLDQPELVLEYISPDGEEGFPGELKTTVKYFVNKNPMEIGKNFFILFFFVLFPFFCPFIFFFSIQFLDSLKIYSLPFYLFFLLFSPFVLSCFFQFSIVHFIHCSLILLRLDNRSNDKENNNS